MGSWEDFLKRHGYNADGTKDENSAGTGEKSDWEKFLERHGYNEQGEKVSDFDTRTAETPSVPAAIKPITIQDTAKPAEQSIMHPGTQGIAAQQELKATQVEQHSGASGTQHGGADMSVPTASKADVLQSGVDFLRRNVPESNMPDTNKLPVLSAVDEVKSIETELSAAQKSMDRAVKDMNAALTNYATTTDEDGRTVFLTQEGLDAYNAAIEAYQIAAQKLNSLSAEYEKATTNFEDEFVAAKEVQYNNTDFAKYLSRYEEDRGNGVTSDDIEAQVKEARNVLDYTSRVYENLGADKPERNDIEVVNARKDFAEAQAAYIDALIYKEWYDYFSTEANRGAEDWKENVARGKELFDSGVAQKEEFYQTDKTENALLSLYGLYGTGVFANTDDGYSFPDGGVFDANRIYNLREDIADKAFPTSPEDIDMLSDDERDMFYYLLSTDPENARSYYDKKIQEKDAESVKALSEWAGKNTGTRILSYLTSRFLLLSVMPTIDSNSVVNGLTASEMREALDAGIAQGITDKGTFNQGWLAGTIDEDVPVLGGKGLGNVAQLFASIGDSVVAMYTGGEHGSIMLASDAGAKAYRNALLNGATQEQALVDGLAEGIAEALFEKLSIGEFLDQQKLANITWENLLKQGGVEASEEVFTTLANKLSQSLILGGQSDYGRTRLQYIMEGASPEEATRKALKDELYSILDDALGGFFSGGAMTLGSMSIRAISNAYTDVQKEKIKDANNGFLYFDAVQQTSQKALDAQWNAYNVDFFGGDVETMKQNGLSDDEIEQAQKVYNEIISEYEKASAQTVNATRIATAQEQAEATAEERAGTEEPAQPADVAQEQMAQAAQEQTAVPAEQTAAPVELAIDPKTFTPETAAEDAQSVVQQYRQMEQDGTLQNRSAAEELLKAAEAATVHVQNAEATGRLTSQQAYDSELALRQVIESAKTVLAQNNTPAQVAPVNEIGGMENGRTESVNESQERQAVLGADESNRAVPEGAAARANRGRSDSYEIARAVNAGQVDRTSAKAEGIEHGSRNETMLILKDSVVNRIEALKSTRDEAAQNGMNIKFFSGYCEINRNGKTIKVDGVYNPDTNTYYVKADQITRNAEQIYRHETFHKMLLENPGMREYCVELLMEQYSNEELDRLVAQYYEFYKDLYGVVTDGMSADEKEALGNKYLDELLADAYAGIRRGGINTVKAEQAMAAFRSDRTDSGKENAAAIERTNGPGENKTAGTEDGGVQRYSAEDGVEEPDTEEYKKPITAEDIQLLRSIIAAHNGKRVSINDFTSEDIQKSSKWAYKFFQQMGTKSPFFRAWFGDWRANDITPIVTVDRENGTPFKAGKVENNDTSRTISWGNQIKTEVHRKYGRESEQYHLLDNILDIAKNAVLFETNVSEPTGNSKMPNTAFMHSLYAVVDNGDSYSIVKLLAEESMSSDLSADFIRGYELQSIETIKKVAKSEKGVLADDSGLTQHSATINTIADLYAAVKRSEKNNHLRTARNVNSALLNEDGTPKLFYHGAKNGGGFEVFKNWQYFTEQEQYAQRYAKRDDPSAMYAVYLTADKVFDTRNADAAEVLDSIREEYGLSELQDTGLPDWTDGYDITDYLSEHPELGYDAVLLDEGGDLVDGKPVSRGTSIVIKDPAQVKSATDNIGTYDRGNENYRYSVEDDAAEYDEDYRRAVQKDAAEDEPTEKGITVRNGKETADPDYAAEGFARIRKNAQEASLQQLRQMIKKTEEKLNAYKILKRAGELTDRTAEKMKTVEETLKIQKEELKNKNKVERKAREKRQVEEAKKQQPRIAKKELKAKLAESFHVAPGSRKITNDLIEQAANKIIQRGYLDAEDKRSLFNALLKSGVVNIAPEGYYGEIRSYVQQGRIYVPESVREEFGDDWNDFKNRAFGNRIFLTTHTSDRGIDDWNADLAQMFPGGFEEGATDMKEALEQIVRLAEEGSAENITIAEMMERNQDNYGWSVENQMEALEEKFDAALKSFAEKANVEIKARQEKATEVLKERRRMREMIERERNRKWESEQRNHVMKLLQQLNRMRNRTAPEIKAMIDEVLKDIDTVARSISVHGIENLIDLAKIYEAAKEDPNFIPNPYVEARLSRLQQTQLDDMEIGDVIELGRVVSALVHSVQEANRLHSEEYKAEIDATARSFVEEMKATKGSKGGKLYQWAVENHLSPVRMIRHLGGWAEGGASAQIAQSLENGQTRQMRYLMEASQIFDRFMSDKANRKWLEKASGKNAEWIKVSVPVNYDVNENDQTEIKWQDVEITPMMRVALYMHSLNFDNLRHIEGGGMTIPNRAYYEKGDMQNAYAYGTRVKMSPETVRAIVKDCTPTERAFAKLLSEYYNQYSKDHINEVSMKLDGFERAGGDNYYHIKVNQNFLDKLPDTIQKNISIESIGSIVNERVYAQTPIVLEDASVSLADHMKQISQYYGFAVPIHDYTAITNYTAHETGNAFSGSVKEVMGQKWGAGAEKYLNKLMEDLQSSTGINEMAATFLKNLRGKLAGASLMFNPAVALSQTASYPGAMQTLGARALAEGLKLWERVDTSLIEKYSPLLWYRNQGNSTQELGDYMDGQTMEHKLPWLLGWIQKMDSATVRRLWAASESYVSDNTDLRPGSEAEIAAGTDEYYQKVAEIFNRAVYDTQPNYSTMQRPQILRSNSDLTKFLTMFKTVPLQYYNMMFEATGRLTNAKRRGNAEEIKSAAGYFARTAVGLISANAIYVAMKALLKVLRFKDKDYRDEEGELTFSSFMEQLGLDFLDTSAGSLIGGAELLDAVERIVAAVGGEKQRYNGVDINAISFLSSIVQDVLDLSSAIGELDGKDLASAIKGILKDGVMGFLGLPAENAETYLLALTKWISPEAAERYENLFSDRSKSTLSEEHGRYLEAAISVYMDNRTEDLPDEVKQELQRLWEAGQKNAIPSAVPSSVTVGGESIALTSDQKAQFRKDWSKIVSEHLEAIIGSEYYQNADETTQGKLIDRLYRYASEVAKANLGIDYTAENWAVSADTDGLPEYLTYYTLRSMLDRDGDETQNTAAVAAVMDYVIGGISEDDSAEIARLYMGGAEGLIPQTAPTSFTYKDENGVEHAAELDAEKRAKYAEAFRSAIGDQLGALMSSPEYADADDKGRAALIGKVFDFAAGVAKAEVAEGYTPDKWILNGFEDMEDGIQLADYIVYHTGYTRLNGKNEDGESESGLKDRRTLDLIDGNDWTDDQKISVYLDNCSNAAAGKVKAMDAAGFSWKQIKTVLTADKQEIAVLQANVSDSAKLKVLEIYCNEKQMAKYQVGYQFDVSFKDYAEVMQNADTSGNGSITQDEAKEYIKSMALSPQAAAYLFQMVTDAKNGKNNPFSPTFGAEFYYEMHKND